MINKIFKQRMEDPTPLENRARGVPAAFAAIVRKLMSKKPDERYQNCRRAAGRPGPLDRPRRVRAILGAEAEAARSFRPPPPELDEDDLRLLDGDESAQPRCRLAPRPRRRRAVRAPRDIRLPLPPLPALVRTSHSPRGPLPTRRARASSGTTPRWLVQFAIIALAVGIIAIILIAIFFRS